MSLEATEASIRTMSVFLVKVFPWDLNSYAKEIAVGSWDSRASDSMTALNFVVSDILDRTLAVVSLETCKGD